MVINFSMEPHGGLPITGLTTPGAILCQDSAKLSWIVNLQFTIKELMHGSGFQAFLFFGPDFSSE